MIPSEKQREGDRLGVREGKKKKERTKIQMVRRKMDCKNQAGVKRSNNLRQERD